MSSKQVKKGASYEWIRNQSVRDYRVQNNEVHLYSPFLRYFENVHFNNLFTLQISINNEAKISLVSSTCELRQFVDLVS